MEHNDPSAEPFDVTRSAAAAILGIHVDTLVAWTDAGRLSCFRTIGGHRRYRRSDLEALRDRLTVDATPEGGAA